MIPFLRKVDYPDFRHVLLVESGSREVLEEWIRWASRQHPRAAFDLVTCFLGEPAGGDWGDRIYRTSDYLTSGARERLAAELRANRYTAVAILCTAEPVMTRWKWFLAWRIGAPLVIINENGDWFPFHRGFWKTIAGFVAFRAGLSGSGALTQPARLLALPFAVVYLLLFAAGIHLRRKLRKGFA